MMFLTTSRLFDISPGCVSLTGLKFWLWCSKVPYVENHVGEPLVQKEHEIKLLQAPDCFDVLYQKNSAFDRHTPGCYFLMNGDETVYVGMTKSIFTRMEKHVRSEIEWDRGVFVPTKNAEHALAFEEEMIARLQPKHNLAKINSAYSSSSKEKDTEDSSGFDVPVFAELKSL